MLHSNPNTPYTQDKTCLRQRVRVARLRINVLTKKKVALTARTKHAVCNNATRESESFYKIVLRFTQRIQTATNHIKRLKLWIYTREICNLILLIVKKVTMKQGVE